MQCVHKLWVIWVEISEVWLLIKCSTKRCHVTTYCHGRVASGDTKINVNLWHLPNTVFIMKLTFTVPHSADWTFVIIYMAIQQRIILSSWMKTELWQTMDCSFQKNNGGKNAKHVQSNMKTLTASQFCLQFLRSPYPHHLNTQYCSAKKHTHIIIFSKIFTWLYRLQRKAEREILWSLCIRSVSLCIYVLKPEAASLADAAASSLNKYEDLWRTATKSTPLERVLAWLTVWQGVWTVHKTHPSYSNERDLLSLA